MRHNYSHKIATSTMLVIALLASLLASAASAQSRPHIDIVVLGDSFTSGNGALDYYGPRGCYQSPNNYSAQYQRKLESVGYSTSYTIEACSGAVTADIPNQLAALSAAEKRDADLVFVSMGGNDVHFSTLVIKCFVPVLKDQNRCPSQVNDAFDQIPDVKSRVYERLREVRAQMPGAQVVLVGYPYLVDDCDGSVIYTMRNGYKVGEKVRELGLYADAIMKQLTRDLGSKVSYVSLLDPFANHEVCGDQNPRYLRGNGDTLNQNEWWHPTVQGHAKTAQVIFEQGFHNLGSVPPDTTPDRDSRLYPYLPFACNTVVPYASTYNGHGESVDLPMPSGTPIIASANGRVAVKNDEHGYGKYVDLTTSNGVVHRYAHMNTVSVANGTSVSQGTVLGTVGSTGNSTGPHLHYEYHSNGQKMPSFGGEKLTWNSSNAAGFATTTHSLTSANCASGGGVATASVDDVIVWERSQYMLAPSDGYDFGSWSSVGNDRVEPDLSVACDFKSGGTDEYIVYEADARRMVAVRPDGIGGFPRKEVANNLPNISAMACIDWNLDGHDDIIIHDADTNRIRYGRSTGSSVNAWFTLVSGIGKPTYFDACDINGDNKPDIVSYEEWGQQLMVGTYQSKSGANWQHLLTGISSITGMTCGDFTSHRGDELVVWQPANNGSYVIGEFNRQFQRTGWEYLQPQGLARPFNGELASGDIDGDGKDELVVNEYRSERGDHSIMIADFTGSRVFRWYPYLEGITPRSMAVGNFAN